jgi:hypothetical protein
MGSYAKIKKNHRTHFYAMEHKNLFKKLLREEENITLDFKREITLSSDREKMEFAKDVSAFANTNGGYIVFGKEDPKHGGKIVGIKKESFDSEQMHQIISNRCSPTIIFTAELLRIGNKWFGLLSIPPSKAKPHELIGPWEVWVRRGDTTARASERDRTFMRKEGEGHLNVDEEAEKPSEKYKAKVLPMAFLTLFLMLFLPFQLATFWILGLGFGISTWFNIENLAFVFFFVIVSGTCSYFFENSFSNLLLRSVRKWALSYFLFYLVFVISISILNLAIFLYPETIRAFFEVYWLNFLQVSIVLLILTFIAVFVLHFPLTEYCSALEDEKYLPNPKGEIKALIQNFSSCVRKLRKRLPAFMILLMLAFPAVVVPMDLHFGLFTPSYQSNGETFSHAYPFTSSDILYLFIYSTRMSPQNVTSEYMFYRLAQTQYTIYPAKLPLSNLISIPNPTNITSASTGQPFLPSSDVPNANLGSCYLNVSKNIGYTFVPKSYNFTIIDFNVTGMGEQVTANLTYWKLVNPNVVITTLKPEYTDLGNGTWLESYTYLISNNEKLPLDISGLEFDRFNYQIVNATSTKVYLNGNEVPYAYFAYNNMLGNIISYFTPNQLNVTVTFQSTDIS